MKIKFMVVLNFVVLFSIPTLAQINWPNGAKAAVVFTYDDGLDCHLDVAMPQLDEFNLKGTFYCTGNSQSLFNRVEEWRNMADNGHELGNHTLFHPCDGAKFDWVKPEYDLNKYTVEQIMNELRTANSLLKAIDGKDKRSFGYTCSNYKAGGVDFTNEVKKMFNYARCDGPIPENMRGYKVYKAPSWGLSEPTKEELIDYVKKAKEKGTIAIFMFHSVGGGYLNVGAEEHKALLEFVSTNKDDYYIDTFYNVMDYINSNN